MPWSRAAIAGHGRGVLVGDRERRADRLRAFDEQADRGVLPDRGGIDPARPAGQVHALDAAQGARVGRHRQARDRVLLLARHAQRGPARGDDLEVRRGPQQVGDDRRRLEDLLEVVEDEQDAPRRQPLGEGLGDRLVWHRSVTPTEAAIRDATSIGSRTGSSGTKKTPSGNRSATCVASAIDSRVLPVPPGPVNVSSRVVVEQGLGLGQLVLAADERRQLGGQVVRVATRSSAAAGRRSAGRRRRPGPAARAR